MQQARQGHCVKNDQHQVAAGAIQQNTANRGAHADADAVDYDELCAKRVDADARIEDWALRVDDAYLRRDMTWFSGAAQRELTAPYRLLVTHFFNHQTHHRGQAHALITAAGEKTDDTDLFLVIPQMR